MAEMRHARRDDLEAFVALWRQYLESDGREMLPTEKNLSFAHDLFLMIQDQPESGVVLVVEEDNALVGGLLWMVMPQGFDTTFGKIAQGYGTYLVPEQRRHGWARQMWLEAFSHLEDVGVKSVVLHPHMDNEASLKGVESVGFVPYQTVMVKRLGED